ncbi:MAG: beta-galactosidase GalB [Rariglobus sp.]
MPLPHPLAFVFILLAAVSTSVSAAESPHERTLFTAGWRFSKDDPVNTPADALSYATLKPYLLPTANAFVSSLAARPSCEAPGESLAYTQPAPAYDDSAWRKLDLPHDWGIEGPFDQALPGETGKLPWHGVAWYRKTFDLPASDAGRRITLEIDGAMSYSAVWCNGRLVGGWPYGYSSYQVDLTPYLKPGAANTLAIRLDNPKESSRWYPGGGIYRNVWLTKTSLVHIAQWGTHVTTPEISAASATVSVTTDVTNSSTSPAQVSVVTQLFRADSSGRPVGKSIAASAPADLTFTSFSTARAAATLSVKKPALWDLTTPNRYVAVTLINQDGKLIDRVETPFGIRTIVFTADKGFFLNGRHVPLQGVCQHHDLGALGAAFNTRAAERQIEILKEMGVNAIRTSHNPPAPEFLELCDRMGILVMDEFVDCWKRPKKPNGYNQLFSDWSEADVRSFVRRDRNHPSVILWSIGNEIPEQGYPEGPAMAAELSRLVKLEDTTRPTTLGSNEVWAGYHGFQNGVDVFGYNYKPWEYKKFHEANPSRPLIGSETASTISSRGEYFFPATDRKDGGKSDFQVSSYDLYTPGWATTPDTEFKAQDEYPFATGEFVWTGFDYLGEPTPYNNDATNILNYHTPEARAAAEAELKALGKIRVPSRSSYFGIIDLAGFKKDRFYLYQARWRPDLPMAHILPHWNWPGREGQVTPVHVYTSGDSAELFLNGQSLGRQTKAPLEYRLRWNDVKYAPGELKVVAYKSGKKWATETVRTTGPATKLLASADRAKITPDSRDLSFITVTIADAEGRLVPRTHNALTFTITGPGELIATDNGDATDHTTFSSPNRKAYNGLALAIVRLQPGAKKPVTIRITADGLTSAEVVIRPAK